MVARRAHNPKVAGSSPAPATKMKILSFLLGIFYFKSMFYVYVIKSSEGYNYTGMTEDIAKRLKEHNDKTLSFWTKRGNNWKLIYREEFETKTDALKREKWLKTGVGREYLKKIVKDY